MAPMVADFAEITVEVALKPTHSTSLRAGSRGGQTLFDFGSSTDHCFKLLLSRAGKPTLVTVVDGKETSLSAPKLARGEWTTVRVEIDGSLDVARALGEQGGLLEVALVRERVDGRRAHACLARDRGGVVHPGSRSLPGT